MYGVLELEVVENKILPCLPSIQFEPPNGQKVGVARGRTEFDWRRLTRAACDSRPQNRCRSAAVVTEVAGKKSISIKHLPYLSPNSAGLRRTGSMHLRIEKSGLITQRSLVQIQPPQPNTEVQTSKATPTSEWAFCFVPAVARPLSQRRPDDRRSRSAKGSSRPAWASSRRESAARS